MLRGRKMRKIVIATRGSALALWQSRHIEALLREHDKELQTELLILKTKGDAILDVPLAKVGGKGLFVKEIEEALLDGRADIAVHSMKDVPMLLPEGLELIAVPEREVHSDVFLSEKYAALTDLPAGARVGTSSLRRQAQILAMRPDLEIAMLRGNVETRVQKMRNGLYDGIVLASAGLKRLGISTVHMQELAPPQFLSASGQGALGVEAREDREDLRDLFSFLDHRETRLCVWAERAFLRRLNGGCQVPIAAHASLKGMKLELSGLVAEPDGSSVLRGEASGKATLEEAEAMGAALADELIARGADEILKALA